MAFFVLFLMLLLAITAHSNGTYCVCKDGGSNPAYQKTLDYACGNGADCTSIQQNGACFNPNTVKDHCNYAVNSYFQIKGQATGSCDFSGTATTIASLPSQQSSTCVYPSSDSSTGIAPTPTIPTTTPTTPANGIFTPTSPNTTPTSPAIGTATPTTPAIVTTTPTTPAVGTSSSPIGTITPPTFGTPPSVFGLGSTSITPSTDSNKAHSNRPLLWPLTIFLGSLIFLSS